MGKLLQQRELSWIRLPLDRCPAQGGSGGSSRHFRLRRGLLCQKRRHLNVPASQSVVCAIVAGCISLAELDIRARALVLLRVGRELLRLKLLFPASREEDDEGQDCSAASAQEDA